MTEYNTYGATTGHRAKTTVVLLRRIRRNSTIIQITQNRYAGMAGPAQPVGKTFLTGTNFVAYRPSGNAFFVRSSGIVDGNPENGNFQSLSSRAVRRGGTYARVIVKILYENL